MKPRNALILFATSNPNFTSFETKILFIYLDLVRSFKLPSLFNIDISIIGASFLVEFKLLVNLR